MSKQLLNTNGEKLGEITLNEAVFGVEPNLHVMHLALRRQLNNARQGSACAKTRAEVSGGGKKATVTVLFADIRGFTSMSETMSAQQVSEILNEYFTEMEPIITKYNGIINKFIGDAVMAIFGEPIQDKNHASNAVRCGYEMLQKVKELQKKWAAEDKPKIEIGIGINTGEVFVGNIGSVNRMEYTVIGDTVNLASRLESYNKVYKTKMLISSSTYAATKSFIDVIKISDVEIRGKSHKMNIYEVLKVI